MNWFNMSTSVMAGLVALTALTGSHALARQDGHVPTSATLLPDECFGGELRRGFTSRADTLVYDNTRLSYFTNPQNPRQLLDDIELEPGAAGSTMFPLVINGINVGFTAQTIANFDIEVVFYDGINETAAAGTAVNTFPPLSAPIVIQIRNLPNTGGFQTGMVSLAGMAGGGVTAPDGGMFVRVRFLQPGTTTLATTVTNTYASSWNTGGTDWTSTLPTGRSISGAFRDVNGDGILDGTEFRTFTFPAVADQYLALRAALPATCTADFNGDGVVDFFDYLDFVDAFSVGCP